MGVGTALPSSSRLRLLWIPCRRGDPDLDLDKSHFIGVGQFDFSGCVGGAQGRQFIFAWQKVLFLLHYWWMYWGFSCMCGTPRPPKQLKSQILDSQTKLHCLFFTLRPILFSYRYSAKRNNRNSSLITENKKTSIVCKNQACISDVYSIVCFFPKKAASFSCCRFSFFPSRR